MKRHIIKISLAIFITGLCLPKIVSSQDELKTQPLKAAVASGFLKIPVGSPTGGYGQKMMDDSPRSPYADKFPGTYGIHTNLRIKVVVLDNGSSQINLVSIDTIGVKDQFLQSVVARVKSKTNGTLDLTDKLIVSATHTHSGPGRLTTHKALQFAMDTYSQELFNLVVEQISDVIIKAHEQLKPARIGFGAGENDEISNDRRCENPPLKNKTMWIMRVDHADGTPMAVIVNFAMHGTVLGSENHYFSVDGPGLIEQKIQEQFKTPVLAVFMQSSGGDMSPNTPEHYPINSKWDGMEAIGNSGAATALQIYNSIQTTDRAELGIINALVPLNREAIGYKGREFPHKYGAFLCGMGYGGCDEDYKTHNPAMGNCPISGKENSILYTRLAAFRIGDHIFVTLPGEPHASLWYELKEKTESLTGNKNVILIGYSQDHLGYIMLPDDWWQGGYEASMNPWGWKMGEYLIGKSELLVKELLTGQKELAEDEAVKKLAAYDSAPFTPVQPGVSIQAGEVSKEASVSEDGGAATFAWFGGDSWIDYPEVTVEFEKEGKWNALLRGNGMPFDGSTYETFLNYKTYPSYKEDTSSTKRKFEWQIEWRLVHTVPSALKLTEGKYRFHVKGQYADDTGIRQYEVYSNPFDVSLN
ncbi:MAG: neutral/alkaline non-lysosomal ceramidase N-terminal domain-containing protein [bacterium]